MKNQFAVLTALCATTALAMPAREELTKAQSLVAELMAPTLNDFRAKWMTATAVAEMAVDYAATAKTEAEKFMLYRGSIPYYVHDEAYDKAAEAVTSLKTNVKDVPAEVIAEIVEKATADMTSRRKLETALAKADMANMRRLEETLAKATANKATANKANGRKLEAAVKKERVTLVHKGFFPIRTTLIWKGASLKEINRIVALSCGANTGNCHTESSHMKGNDRRKTFQFQFDEDSYRKCVCVELVQREDGVYGRAVSGKYAPAGREIDFDVDESSNYGLAVGENDGGYGLMDLRVMVEE